MLYWPKNLTMNRQTHNPDSTRDTAQEIRAGQPSANPQGTRETTVTQLTPDDELADGGAIEPADDDGTPSRRQLEQDVMTVNPSLDSMESRG